MRSPIVWVGVVLLMTVSVMFFFVFDSPVKATSTPPLADRAMEAIASQEYESLLARYQDWTFLDLRDHLNLDDFDSTVKLGFEPTKIRYYDVIKERLKMTEEEESKFSSNGLVVVDPKLGHGFGSVYYQIYCSDLPVLITTDSVLHAWHRSYDNILIELESKILLPTLQKILGRCHAQLSKLPEVSARATTYRDVDLYLCVSRNLLLGAGSEHWDGKLVTHSVLGNDQEVIDRLRDIQSLKLQTQFSPTEHTNIYGGKRYVDYSQFRPRGHYTKSSFLQNYFRCMMWMGRADCGFNVLPVDPKAGLTIDWRRELQAAVLLSQLVRDSKQLPQLRSFCELVRLLVGESDNLTVSNMLGLLSTEHVDVGQLDQVAVQDALADAIQDSGLARQKIRSQSITSKPWDTYKVPPPSMFQVLGQAFTVDSFVLSHSVFDSIIFEGRKKCRMLPVGLDVAAAIGNDFAVALLEPELRKWKYGANVLASRDFVHQIKPAFWNDNIYHRWLAALRNLDDEPTGQFPKVMTSKAWKAKQLQTQLASWAELRHDNVLYTKQSYTSVPGCQYPDAYVEPYPVVYGRLAAMAKEMGTRLDKLWKEAEKEPESAALEVFDRQKMFLQRFAVIMSQLEKIAKQELNAQPMTAVQRRFLENTVDRRGTLPNGSGSKPKFDGWYFELLYGVSDPLKRDPLVADVHTNPTKHEVLQAGVGNVHFAVVAIDNENDTAAYVGPVYSYYEFVQPAEQRMTDNSWASLVSKGPFNGETVFSIQGEDGPPKPRMTSLPPRPEWSKLFTAPPRPRKYDGLFVSNKRETWALNKSEGYQTKVLLGGRADDNGLVRLLAALKTRDFQGRFGVFLGEMTELSLQRLAEEPQLSWINTTGSKLPPESIAKFAEQRPDVEVLPEPFAIDTAAVCHRIDGWQRFDSDESGKIQAGKELLVYVEANNLTARESQFAVAAKLEVSMKLANSDGTVLLKHQTPAFEIKNAEYFTPAFLSAQIQLPEKLEPGSYRLEIHAKDTYSAKMKAKFIDGKFVLSEAPNATTRTAKKSIPLTVE